jgi:hypothetical protein
MISIKGNPDHKKERTKALSTRNWAHYILKLKSNSVSYRPILIWVIYTLMIFNTHIRLVSAARVLSQEVPRSKH